MSRTWIWTLLILGAALLPLNASAENSVIMESKWVETAATNVQLGIYIANDDPMACVVIPIEFRAIHVGSFITRRLWIRAQARMASLEEPGTEYQSVFKMYFPRKRPVTDRTDCALDSLGLVWRWSPYDSLPDFVGEEAFMYAGLPSPAIPAGDDGYGSGGAPSFMLSFDVTDAGGAFVIDTTCMAPSNHLSFVRDRDAALIEPSFDRGIVLIGCEADCHGDPLCDGVCNLIDAVEVIDVAFNGAPPVIDPDPRCPIEDTDVNCDAVTNSVDVVKMTNVLYRHSLMAAEFCLPCNHIPHTGNPKNDVMTPYFHHSGD